MARGGGGAAAAVAAKAAMVVGVKLPVPVVVDELVLVVPDGSTSKSFVK